MAVRDFFGASWLVFDYLLTYDDPLLYGFNVAIKGLILAVDRIYCS